MKDFIATDDNGNVVGKWRRSTEPIVPDDYDVKQVDDVAAHSVDYWFDDNS